MDNTTNDFDEIENTAAEKRKVLDFNDLQNELSGNEVGRISRFTSAESQADLKEKRTGTKSGGMTALEFALLNDPAFIQAHSNAMGILGRAESAAERALKKFEDKLPNAEDKLQHSLDDAQHLPDGRAVFKNMHGDVVTANNELIDQGAAATIEWRGDEPSYETYLTQRNRVQEIKDSIYEIRVYQTDILGNARAELTDPNHSGSVGDIEATENRILDRAPDFLRAELQQIEVGQHPSANTTFSVEKPIF